VTDIYEYLAGKLEEALEEYKRSQRYGVERAGVHIQSVSETKPSFRVSHLPVQVGAKIRGQKMKEVKTSDKSEG